MGVIYLKTSQGRIRQTREVHRHVSITRMSSGGEIVGFLLWVHVRGQLEESNDVIKLYL